MSVKLMHVVGIVLLLVVGARASAKEDCDGVETYYGCKDGLCWVSCGMYGKNQYKECLAVRDTSTCPATCTETADCQTYACNGCFSKCFYAPKLEDTIAAIEGTQEEEKKVVT